MLDCEIEAVEALEKTIPAESLRCERVYHIFDFVGDNIAAGEVGVVEHRAKDALGQQVLDEHLLDRGFREVGV